MAEKERIEKALKTGAWITLVVYIVNYALSLINIQPKQLFGVSDYLSYGYPVSSITTTVGAQFISILQKFITFDIGAVVAVYLSAVIIFIIGSFAYDFVKFPKVRGDWQYLTAVIVYGTLPFYLIFVGYGMPAIPTIIGFLVYTVALAISFQIFKGITKNLI